MKTKIEHIITLGDSLSDRGTMDHRKLFGIIPMAGLSGLTGHSPLGRFGNGLVWDDDLAIELYGQFSEAYEKEREKALAKRGIVVKHDDLETPEEIINQAVIDNYRQVQFHNQDIFRNYNEGGLTSYDWSCNISADISVDIKSRILSNLDQKRALLIQDDQARGISQSHKDKSLIVEWSGANDLLTVHSNIYEPEGLDSAMEQVRRAIDARIRNIEALSAQGYKHFVLFNLPDLSLTPRFQNPNILKTYVDDPDQYERVRENAHRVSQYFNEELSRRITALRETLSEDSGIHLFDVNYIFCDAYENPERYGLSSRLKSHGVSIDFPNVKHEINATNEDGYMFWDEVHPTSKVHEILAERFQEDISQEFEFTAPHESLLEIFKETYGQRLLDDRNGCFGFFRRSRMDYLDERLTLDMIFNHGLNNKGYRTRSTMVALGWITNQGELASDHPRLIEAFNRAAGLEQTESSSHIQPLELSMS